MVKKKKEKAVIFDLDGTLANPYKHKQKHKVRNEGWAEEARTAPAIRKNVKKLRKQEKKGEDVVIMTARSAHYKKETKEWLKHHNIKPKELIMRPVNNKKYFLSIKLKKHTMIEKKTLKCLKNIILRLKKYEEKTSLRTAPSVP
jgi:FMN phosphatase YigB (HAD superfamily)